MNIGIDLGTTNSTLAFLDAGEAAHVPPIRLLPIPQHVSAERIEPRRTLPSFLLLDRERYIGVYAREQGILTPTRLVYMAKSWLSNPEVDRTEKILPWDADLDGRILSPVEASAAYLGHLRHAWDEQSSAKLADQNVVLTVPASFDEEARELTVEAARQAGLERLTLLEEPAAAFYAWIVHHFSEAKSRLADGQLILIVDVGGGTTDFTLIRVSRQGDEINFTRTAVGPHLLLGGDNFDLKLSWLAEAKLGARFSLSQRVSLLRQCTAVKEGLLADPGPSAADIRIAGAGAGLVAGTRTAEIRREEVLEVLLDGFLELCSLSDEPREGKKSLFRDLGLPYVSDPAVTRHLARFLRQSQVEAEGGPDAVLFNGGFLIPQIARDRLTDAIESWFGRRPWVLENSELDAAVAIGAAYYSYVRSTGRGVVVRGGLPRAYYLQIQAANGPRTESDRIRAICVVPRGAEEGTELEVDPGHLQLLANTPVSFRLHSSRTRTEDQPGDLVEFPENASEAELHTHAPLRTVIRFGRRRGPRSVPVKLAARLTEVGTLELWSQSKIDTNRWRLQFQLREQERGTAPTAGVRTGSIVVDEALQEAEELVRAVFAAKRETGLTPEELPSRLEQVLGLGKLSWPLEALRRLGDILLELREGRERAANHELRWFNLCGFCLRPGFGFPGDDWRVEQARQLYRAGLKYDNKAQNQIEWYIFWGRVAGGMNRNQQADIYQRMSATLLPRTRRRKRVNPALLRQMWRTAASLELLPVQTKVRLGEALLERIARGEYSESEFWCLSRLGARKLLYGPANQVVPPGTASRWVQAVLNVPEAGEALAATSRHTGDEARDLSSFVRDSVRKVLEEKPNRQELLALFQGEEPQDSRLRDQIFGEELPSGLVIQM